MGHQSWLYPGSRGQNRPKEGPLETIGAGLGRSVMWAPDDPPADVVVGNGAEDLPPGPGVPRVDEFKDGYSPDL